VGTLRDGPNDYNNNNGMISWNPRRELTPLPQFYGDGAARPLAGELITAIAGGEMYFVIDAVGCLLSLRGYGPITALHGGELIGRKVMNWLGNSPRELEWRSGLTRMAMRREWWGTFGKGGEGRGRPRPQRRGRRRRPLQQRDKTDQPGGDAGQVDELQVLAQLPSWRRPLPLHS
jgi:hypothetical protein